MLETVVRGLRPGKISVDDPMPGVRKGWQRGVAAHVGEEFRDCTPTSSRWLAIAPKRSRWQACRSVPSHHPQRPSSSSRSSACCSSDVSGVHLILSASSCRCGRPLDPSGHHRAACPYAGVLGRRGFPLESARSKRVQRGRRESDCERASPGSGPASQSRSRQSPIKGGGRWTPPCFTVLSVAIDTTMVFQVRMDGSPRRQCAFN